MARQRVFLLGLAALTMFIQGCTTPTSQPRAARPTFAHAAPQASTESWASVMPMPGTVHDTLAYARRDAALGMPPADGGYVYGSWRGSDRPSIERYFIVPLQRSPRSFLFFTSPGQYERRAPRVPSRAHPWHTAW